MMVGASVVPLQAAYNLQPAHVVLVDRFGWITSTSRAWDEFAHENGFNAQSCGRGWNYLEVCAAAERMGGEDAADAAVVRAGLLAVLHGYRRRFRHTYPCHGPGGRRWFEVMIAAAPIGGAILAHTDVTAQCGPDGPDIDDDVSEVWPLMALEVSPGRADGALREAGGSWEASAGLMAEAAGVELEQIALLVHGLRRRTDALQGELRRREQEIGGLRAGLERAWDAAGTDQLTGLGNRRRFDHVLSQVTGEALRTGEPLSLLLFDIDHFKKFNDTYGHATGDLVLQLVAERVRSTVRSQDVTARYGGEEFAVLLPRTPLTGAAELAERIRTVIATRQLQAQGSGQDVGRVTVSIGVAAYRPGESLEALVARADEGLYAAKRQGRNCVVTERQIEGDEAWLSPSATVWHVDGAAGGARLGGEPAAGSVSREQG